MIIRDPVHGDIELGPAERRVLDTREVQRLRGIKQLGTAHLVYPGCVHTRFDHSLGTLAMSKRLIGSLRRNGFDVPAADEELVAIAALVHDISHIPFGHTFEDERRIFPRHDNPRRLEAFLAGGEIGQVLDDLGLQQEVLHLLTGRLGGARAWLGQVVSSTIDADLLDYLRRDSYFAGLSESYDDRILSSFIIEAGQLVVSMTKHGMDRPDTRSEIMHLLRMRYFLTERVYTHHAKIASGAMISKAVELAVARGLQEEDLYGLTDASFFNFLASFAGTGGAPDPAIARLVTAVQERRLLKRAYVLSAAVGERRDDLIARYSGLGSQREDLEERIRQGLGLAPGEVVVYCPPAGHFKEVLVPVKTSRGVFPLGELDQPLAGEAYSMRQQYAQLWRFYVFVPPAQALRAGRSCEEILGEPNEYVVAR